MQHEIKINSTSLASLGSPIQTYRAALSTRIAAGLLTFIGGGLAFIAAYFLFFGLQHAPNDGGSGFVFELIFGLPLSLLGLFLVWQFVQLCTLFVTIYEDGISAHSLRNRRSAAWADVSSITIGAPPRPNPAAIVLIVVFCWLLLIPYLLPRARNSLRLKNGDTIRIPSALTHETSLVDSVDRAIARAQLPAMIERLQGGIRCEFGTLSVEADGMHSRKQILPWRDLQLVTRTASGLSVFRKGTQSPWASVPLKAVPNPTLFQALVDRACERIDG